MGRRCGVIGGGVAQKMWGRRVGQRGWVGKKVLGRGCGPEGGGGEVRKRMWGRGFGDGAEGVGQRMKGGGCR